jgi:7-keto-8-aminopelargonate synthetase-like enzyme
LAALRHIKAHPELVERLSALSAYARQGLKTRGLEIKDSETPIIPIFTYDMENTLRIAAELYDRGVYVNTVLPPAAPSDGCMLRTSYMASLTEELLDEAMDIIAEVVLRYNASRE